MNKNYTRISLVAVLALITITVGFAGWRAQAARGAGFITELKAGLSAQLNTKLLGRKAAGNNAAAAPVKSAPSSAMAFATITVDTTADDNVVNGNCTLREAITAANTNAAVDACAAGVAGADVIEFALGAGTPTINVLSALPAITDPVTINGNAGGATRVELNGAGAGALKGLDLRAGNSTIAGLVINRFGQHGIEIMTNGGNTIKNCYIGTDANGTVDLGNGFIGVAIFSANNTVGGTNTGEGNLISGNNSHGILFGGSGSSGNQVLGNYIGTDVTGTLYLGNSGSGVIIDNAPNNTVGGTSAGARNLISGNIQGVFIAGTNASGNKVSGNYIGTDVNGTADLGNTNHGVFIENAPNNTIGGTTTAERNVISGNDGHGVEIKETAATGNKVIGNYIGTNAAGTGALGNAVNGVNIQNAPNNTIGGATVAERNVISGNTNGVGVIVGAGVRISGATASGNKVLGNFIGTDATGAMDLGNIFDGVLIESAPNNTVGGTTAAASNLISGNNRNGVKVSGATSTGNVILGNSIFNNTNLGIDLGDNGVTANDTGDGDTGPNNLQNFPVLTCVTSAGGSTTIGGTLNSLATTAFRIEYFVNDACDASGNGEGQTLLGTQNVTTDASGNATLNATGLPAVTVGKFITATATLLDAMGDPVETSEFSACLAVSAPPTLAINDVTLAEGNVGTTNMVFTVTLTGAQTNCLPVTVAYATANGTATAGSDYTATSGTLMFSPPHASNSVTQTITVPVMGETAVEPNETFFVNLTSPTNATISDSQGLGTITNDDSCPTQFTVNDLGDAGDATPGDYVCETATGNGVCTLRAAIQEANAIGATCSPLTINFSVTGTINLATALPNLIHPNLTISGPGANQLDVHRNAASQFRIFTVNSGKIVNLSGLTVSNGEHPSQAGGILNSGGTLTMTDCVVSGNRAPQGGGLQNDGTLIMTGCTVSGNVANGSFGGGLIVYGTSTTLTNCTFSGNNASQIGGGVSCQATGLLHMTNCTVTNNTADGLHIATNAVNATLKNTIIAGNSTPSGTARNVLTLVGFQTGSTNNLLGAGDSGGLTNGVNGNQLNVANALLAALANYGGTTPTHALLPSSPALNAGDNASAPATDQRGIARPQQTTVDIGAYESRGFTLALNGGTPQSTTINTAFATPLKVNVTPNDPSEPVDGGQITFTPPGMGASATLATSPATIASGMANVTAMANATTGGPYDVTASALGVATPVNFALTNACQPPTMANAGPDQSLCATSTMLAGNTPTFGTGMWSIVSGIGGSFVNDANPSTVFNGTAGTTYTLRWTTSNAPCMASTDDVTISFTALNTAAMASSMPTLCINTPLTPITHATTGATGIGTATGLPAGVMATFASNTITISGTPMAAGVFSYSIPLMGGCGTATATGTITVTANNTVGAASASPTLCINTPLTAITHATTGATGIGMATGLPAGVMATFASNTITISGTPMASGVFSYSIPLTGGCGTANATGTITVTANQTAGAASASPTLCINSPLTAITHATTGATGIGMATGLPAGVMATFASNTITISGTPMASGVFTYSIPLTGGCGMASATGTITVNAAATATALTAQTVCQGSTAMFTTTAGGTGPFSYVWKKGATVLAAATNTLTLNNVQLADAGSYSVEVTGACGTVTQSAMLTVNALPVATVTSPTQTICLLGTTTSLGGNTPSTGTTGAWTSSSGGVFSPNASAPNATWTPPANFTGTATLTWTVSSTAGCGASQSANVTVTVNGNPVATVGGAQTIGVNQTSAPLGSGPLPFATTGQWASNSGGSFSNANDPAATWTPPANFTGIATLTWTVSSSVFPTCGTPQTGTVQVTVSCASLTFSPTSLAAASAGTTYSQQLTVTPSGSYTFSIVLGSMPSGLTLNPTTGLISGLTSGIGTFNFTVKALAANGCSATQAYTLVLNCPTITLPSSLATPTINTAYSQTVAATPATGSYSYAVIGGALPAGLTLNGATGVISGTPTTGGAYTFTIRATRFGTCTGSQTYTGTISCPTITLACPSCSTPGVLPNGKVNTLYVRSLAATPSATYSYSVTAGALPPGLSLIGGALSGRPTAAGTYNFTVRAQGSSGCFGTQAYTLTVTTGTLAAKPNQTDFDGDGKSDIWSYRPQDGRWLIQHSSDNTIAFAQLGSVNEVALPADYDGDGKTDAAVFNAAKSRWQIMQSSDGSMREERFGVSDAQAFAADFDGDGKADLVVKSNDNIWQIKQSSDGETIAFNLGNTDDQPVIGDFDGDGWADVAVFNASQQLALIRHSGDGSLQEMQLAFAAGNPLAADFDGDGTDEFAFWSAEKGLLQYRRSSDQQEHQLTLKGQSLLLGDFDGDGLSDCGSWLASGWQMRLSSRNWLIE